MVEGPSRYIEAEGNSVFLLFRVSSAWLLGKSSLLECLTGKSMVYVFVIVIVGYFISAKRLMF